MKPRTRSLAALAAFAALAALALPACGGSAVGSGGPVEGAEVASWGGRLDADGTPRRGGSLRVDQASPPTGITPLHFLIEPDNPTMQVTMQIFNQLVEFRPGSIDPQPGLAKSWEVSKDGLTYTFHLRAAKFSDGMPVTAADAKYTLDFARGPESLFAESMFGQVESVSDPDPRTLVIRLRQPVPALLDYLATAGCGIVPAKLVRAEGVDEFGKHPIGSGPFELKRWRPEQSVELVRNPHYWRPGKPYLDAVEIVVVQNDNARVLNVLSGTSDAGDSVPFSQVGSIDAGSQAKVLVAPGADMGTIVVNNAKAPLDETKVRQALNYATPVEAIDKVVFGGIAPRMNTTMPKLKFWTSRAKAYPYDPGKAEELLAESSVPDGFTVEVKVDGSDESASQIAQIVQQAWGEVGVKVKIELEDVGALGDDFVSGDYEMEIARPGSTTSDVPVDDEFATLLFDDPASHNLFTFYDNPRTRRLAAEAVVALSESERRRLFARLQIEAMRDPNVIPLVYTPNRIAVRDDVKGFNYLLIGFWRLEDVWIG